jgi:hypothetical protein
MPKPLVLAFATTVRSPARLTTQFRIPGITDADPLYRFVKNGKAGHIDHTGKVIIPPTLEAHVNYGSEFHDGLLEIGVSDGRYLDRTGEVVLDKGLDRDWDFSEGLAVAMRKNEKLWGYINTQGEFAISPRFETNPNRLCIPVFRRIRDDPGHGEVRFVDHSGEFVIKPLFLVASAFSDGMARVVTDGLCIYLPEGACASPSVVGGGNDFNYAPCKFSFIDKWDT